MKTTRGRRGGAAARGGAARLPATLALCRCRRRGQEGQARTVGIDADMRRPEKMDGRLGVSSEKVA
eukprot:1135970-Prorocentrum_minimum.AAC.1